MTDDLGSVGSDPLDLELNGTPVRVVCEDPAGAELLQRTFARNVIHSEAPLGFRLQVPTPDQKFFVLLDRSGFVLGRTRSLDESLAILIGHLGAIVPEEPSSIRLRLRTLVHSSDFAVIAVPPLLMLPPVVERRLATAEYRLVDRLAVEVQLDGRLNVPMPKWDAIRSRPVGHTGPAPSSEPIVAALVPSLKSAPVPRAHAIAEIASTALAPTNHAMCLDVSERVTSHDIVSIEPGRTDDFYRVLKRLAAKH